MRGRPQNPDELRVRTVPIDEDGVAPIPGPDPDAQVNGPRPWVPLAVASLAIMAVIGSVSLFGALRVDEPPSEPTSFEPLQEGAATTSTRPAPTATPDTRPRLGEILPDVNDRLTLVAMNDDGVASLLWDPGFRIPVAAIHSIDAEIPGRRISASFDSGGRTLAIQSCGGEGCALYLGSVADVGLEPDVEGSSGFVWHASEVTTIAWLAPIGQNESAVVTGRVNPISGELKDSEVRFNVPASSRLIRWDAHGFVIDEGHATSSFSLSGEPIWNLSRWTAASASDTAIVVTSPELSGWTLADRHTGELADTTQTLPGDEDSFVWLTTSENTDLIGRVTDHGTHYSLMVTGEDITSPKTTKVNRSLRPFGFTNDGRFFVFMTTDRSHLTFIEWRTQETHEVTVPNSYRVLSIDIG
jgi:hypothetical protein